MLMSHNAILRGESLFLSNLSDLCMVNHKEDISNEVEILILRIATGKTNNLKTLFGRCMRHVKVEMCPIGGLGFYLLMRYHVCNENFDFTKNENWFNIKLLISTKHSNYEKSINDSYYAKFVKKGNFLTPCFQRKLYN